MSRVTLAVTDELQSTLDALAQRRNQSRSALVEMLLRESPLVRDELQAIRSGHPTKRGRSLDKLRAIADAGKASWQRAEKEGKVAFRDG